MLLWSGNSYSDNQWLHLCSTAKLDLGEGGKITLSSLLGKGA